MKRIVYMFPGQGSQDVGMGLSFYNEDEQAKQMMEKVKTWLGFDLGHLMFNGPKEQLTETKYAQPALVLASTLALLQLEKENIKPIAVLGHSLGEYSALVASGSLTLEDAVKLVYKRGQLMEQADPDQQGGMSAVLGLEEATISAVLEETNNEVQIANLNCPGQVVISGKKTSLEAVALKLKEKGAKRVMPLAVSGPFHSTYMLGQAEKFAQLLSDVDIKQPKVPVIHNVTAKAAESKEDIADLLTQQLSGRVRFEESIRALLKTGVDAFVEVGHKKVLSGLVKKIDKTARVFHVEDKETCNQFLTWYKEDR